MRIALESRFLEQFKQLCNRSNKKIAVALSGGVDSMSLVHLLSESNAKHFNGVFDITALTVDHKFRKESTAEAHAIKKELRCYNIKHEILTIDWSQGAGSSFRQFEKTAREKRFQILQQYAESNHVGQLYLGHNLDDQIETFIMRLSKNSHFPGLNCTRKKEQVPLETSAHGGDQLQLIRPLLSIWKNDLYEYCRLRNFKWFEDYTNADTSLTPRNRIRHLLSHPDEYNVPTNLQKSYICELLSQIQALQESFETSVSQLQKYLQDHRMVKLNSETLSAELRFPSDTLKRFHPMVFHMYFYSICRVISPSENYHCRFSSIAGNFWDQSSTSIYERLSRLKHMREETFTLLHLTWHCYYSEDDIVIKIKRQTPIRSSLPVVSEVTADSHWVLFDNRVWVKITRKEDIAELRSLRLVLYSSKLKKSYTDGFHAPHLKTSVLNNLPVLVIDEDQVVGFPTLDIVAARFEPYIEMQCAFK